MAAPGRAGSATTLVTASTTIAAGAEVTFDWDTSAAFFGSFNVNAQCASGTSELQVYQCDSEAGTASYPSRGKGVYLGSFVTGTSADDQNFKVYQGLTRIRLYNAGASTITLNTVVGRLYT